MDKRLKQRLIGATVLIALAIIIVPELVRKPAEHVQPAVNTEIPARPRYEFEDRGITISLQATPPSTATPMASQPDDGDGADVPESPSVTASRAEAMRPETDRPLSPLGSSEPPEPTGAAIAPPAPLVPPPRPTPQPAEPPTAPAEPPTAPAEPPTAPAEPPTAPQSPTQTELPRPVLPQIELIGRSQGNGSAQSPATPVPNGGSGWKIQVGSFSREENANNLRDRLRSQQFPGSVERIMVDGQARFRVYVGPVASRDEGESIRERLRHEAGINGHVVSPGG